MPGLQTVKRRIRSVTGTRQITRAMQMVAASKLRRAQEAASGPKAYTAAAAELLVRLGVAAGSVRHPLLQRREVRRSLTIVVAGDRGMAGAYNANVLKELGRHMMELGGSEHQAITVGRYAALHVARTAGIREIAAYELSDGSADIEVARPIARAAARLYAAAEIDAVDIIYTRFDSTVKQTVARERLLPVAVEAGAAELTLEPTPERVIDFALSRLIEAQVLGAVLDSFASEQAARMLAMMNATDNAKELIDDLTLEFNNARQGAITQEIAEISGGAEAVNNER